MVSDLGPYQKEVTYLAESRWNLYFTHHNCNIAKNLISRKRAPQRPRPDTKVIFSEKFYKNAFFSRFFLVTRTPKGISVFAIQFKSMKLNPTWTQPELNLNPNWTQLEPSLIKPEFNLNPNWTQIEPSLNPNWTQPEPNLNPLNPTWTQNQPEPYLSPLWTQTIQFRSIFWKYSFLAILVTRTPKGISVVAV